MTNKELRKVLELHKKWLKNENGGVRANLEGFNLYDAMLIGANLEGANLEGAMLMRADLTNANLKGADLRGADLTGAILVGADLRGADLTGAMLTCVDLYGVVLDDKEKYRLGIILSEARIGYKKLHNGSICKILVPKGAVVFCINGSKCRTNKCEVLEGEGMSMYDRKIEYKVGKKLEIKDFNLMYNVVCGTGIHFFWNKEEAEHY